MIKVLITGPHGAGKSKIASAVLAAAEFLGVKVVIETSNDDGETRQQETAHD